MADERIYFSDANRIRVGTQQAVFGDHRYGTHNIESVSIATEERRTWPAKMAYVAAAIIMVIAWIQVSPSMVFMGAAAATGGTFYLRRRKPKYAVRLVTNGKPVFVLVSKQKHYVDEVKLAVERAMEAAKTANAA